MHRITKKKGIIYILDLRRNVPDKIVCDGLLEFFWENSVLATEYLYSFRASYTSKEIENLLKKAKIKEYTIKNCNGPDSYFQTRWKLIIKK